MRLTCPRCGTTYEVADDAIPASGRDLECSSCEHRWFQLPPPVTLRLDAPGPAAAMPAPALRTPESVLAVLREEAAREIAAREAERAAIVPRPPVPLPRARGVPPTMLPDPAALSDSLQWRPAEAPPLPVIAPPPPPVARVAAPPRPDRHARGFRTAVAVAAALVAVYVATPHVVPPTLEAARPLLAAHAAVDRGRVAWQRMAEGATDRALSAVRGWIGG